MARESKKTLWSRRLREEREWFDSHGGCRAAYVERYGSKDDTDHYGAGGEAIFEADWNELRRVEAEAKRHGVYV